MNQDIHPKFQPEGTYRVALNAQLESTEGDLLTISNEVGNYQAASGFPSLKKVIGHRLLNDGTTVLFLYDPDDKTGQHEIGIYDPKQEKYTTYKASACLGFHEDHYVNAIYRLKNGCERIVYFTDDYNKYRVINLDRPEYYSLLGGTAISTCDLLDYSRTYKTPSFDFKVNNSGGNLLDGTYIYFFRLLDIDRNPTNWMASSGPVSIADELEEMKDVPATMYQYDGGTNVVSEIGYVPPTSKSIDITIDEVDTRFAFAQLAVVKYTASSGAISGIDLLTPEALPFELDSDTTIIIRHTGLNSQIESQITLDELLSSKAILNRVYTHEQKDGRLFVANLSGEEKDYTGFQRHASSIKTEFVEAFEEPDNPISKRPEYYFKDGTFTYDEVEALGIVYI